MDVGRKEKGWKDRATIERPATTVVGCLLVTGLVSCSGYWFALLLLLTGSHPIGSLCGGWGEVCMVMYVYLHLYTRDVISATITLRGYDLCI